MSKTSAFSGRRARVAAAGVGVCAMALASGLPSAQADTAIGLGQRSSQSDGALTALAPQPAPSKIAVTFTTRAQGLNQPLAIANDGTSRLYVVERPGRIRLLVNGKLQSTPWLDATAIVNSDGGEQGMLGLVFAKDYRTSRLFWLTYTNADGALVLARGQAPTANATTVKRSVLMTVLVVPHPTYQNHNGGDLHFGPDGFLYLGTGDGGKGGDPFSNAQNLSKLGGKILRINVRKSSQGRLYSIPAGNPFVRTARAKPEIWALGVRNPWRFSFDSATGQMWIADVGQDGHEEVNVVAKGKGGLNFGWPCREGKSIYDSARCRSTATYTAPRLDFPHNGTTAAFAAESITGGYVYRGKKYASLAAGTYIAADYETANVWLYRPGFPVTRAASKPRLAAFGQDSQGELWAADVENGRLFSIGFKRR